MRFIKNGFNFMTMNPADALCHSGLISDIHNDPEKCFVVNLDTGNFDIMKMTEIKALEEKIAAKEKKIATRRGIRK